MRCTMRDDRGTLTTPACSGRTALAPIRRAPAGWPGPPAPL